MRQNSGNAPELLSKQSAEWKNLLAERDENKFKPYLKEVHTGNKDADAYKS